MKSIVLTKILLRSLLMVASFLYISDLNASAEKNPMPSGTRSSMPSSCDLKGIQAGGPPIERD